MQIKLSTIIISMVVAYLLFTETGQQIAGLMFLVVLAPIATITDRTGFPSRDMLSPIMIAAVIIVWYSRNQIKAWWRTRNIGRRIY